MSNNLEAAQSFFSAFSGVDMSVISGGLSAAAQEVVNGAKDFFANNNGDMAKMVASAAGQLGEMVGKTAQSVLPDTNLVAQTASGVIKGSINSIG